MARSVTQDGLMFPRANIENPSTKIHSKALLLHQVFLLISPVWKRLATSQSCCGFACFRFSGVSDLITASHRMENRLNRQLSSIISMVRDYRIFAADSRVRTRLTPKLALARLKE